jgi:hypothetical protein
MLLSFAAFSSLLYEDFYLCRLLESFTIIHPAVFIFIPFGIISELWEEEHFFKVLLHQIPLYL